MTPGLRVLSWPKHRQNQPYTSLLTSALEEQGVAVDHFTVMRLLAERYDIWHVHWPEAVTHPRLAKALPRTILVCALFIIARAKRTRVVWTVHNIRSHERRHRRLQSILYATLTRCCSGWLTLSSAPIAEIVRQHPHLARKPHAVTPLGEYRTALPTPPDRASARRLWSYADDNLVVLHFGLVRAYKNIGALVESVVKLDDPDVRLLLLGRTLNEGDAHLIPPSAYSDERVHVELGAFDDDRLVAALSAADLCVFPYTEVLNSSSIVTALSFDVPVLCPAIGSIPELATMVGHDWVMTYSGTYTHDTLEAGVRQLRSEGRRRSPDLTALAWPTIAKQTVALYHDVLA
jgi:beta-1,4-mannosyltransferase